MKYHHPLGKKGIRTKEKTCQQDSRNWYNKVQVESFLGEKEDVQQHNCIHCSACTLEHIGRGEEFVHFTDKNLKNSSEAGSSVNCIEHTNKNIQQLHSDGHCCAFTSTYNLVYPDGIHVFLSISILAGTWKRM